MSRFDKARAHLEAGNYARARDLFAQLAAKGGADGGPAELGLWLTDHRRQLAALRAFGQTGAGARAASERSLRFHQILLQRGGTFERVADRLGADLLRVSRRGQPVPLVLFGEEEERLQELRRALDQELHWTAARLLDALLHTNRAWRAAHLSYLLFTAESYWGSLERGFVHTAARFDLWLPSLLGALAGSPWDLSEPRLTNTPRPLFLRILQHDLLRRPADRSAVELVELLSTDLAPVEQRVLDHLAGRPRRTEAAGEDAAQDDPHQTGPLPAAPRDTPQAAKRGRVLIGKHSGSEVSIRDLERPRRELEGEDALSPILKRRFGTPSSPRGDTTPSPPRPGPIQSGPGGPVVPPDDVVPLTRTPHLDLSVPVPAPGSTFTVTVWADRQAPRPGEGGEDLRVAGPASQDRFELDVWLLPSVHFEVLEASPDPLVVERRQERSREVTFTVRVLEREALAVLVESGEAVAADRGSLTAVFFYQGRPAGKVARRVAIDRAAPAPAAVGTANTAPEGALEALPGAPADLTVRIVADPDAADRRFFCCLTTPHLTLETGDREAPWTLRGGTAAFMKGVFRQLVDKNTSPLARRAALEGAGLELFDAAPANFKRVLFRLLETGKLDRHRRPPGTIAVVSEEPLIPWELMRPHRAVGGRRQEGNPLGVDFAVGRVVNEATTAADQRLPRGGGLVIAPRYPGTRRLRCAEAEARLVCARMGARRVDPVSVEVLDSTLAEQPVALLHFVCHGKEVPEEAEQVLFLEEREGALEELSVTMAKGLRGLKEILDRGRPLVFLNACELAGQVPALVSARGFAPAFLGLGARAVVAALWSVDDGVAFRVAVRFYRKLVRDPLARPAEVLRELRARAYGGATAGVDSYAAYCFYGDPLARRAG